MVIISNATNNIDKGQNGHSRLAQFLRFLKEIKI